MSGNTVFAVPKDRLTVRVRLSREIALDGEIFMESMAEGLSIHQKLTAFLENNNMFFPIHVVPSGITEFINKKTLQVVELTLPDDPESSFFAHLHMHTIPLTAYLHDGETLNGLLMAEVPQEKGRLSDCLNLPDKFLTVRSRDKIYYVNKDAVQKAVHAAKT